MTTEAKPELGEFEGRKITRTTINVKRAGDGLSKSQALEPTLLRQGQKVRVVLEGTIGPIHMKPIGDTEEERCADLLTEVATVVDAQAVEEILDATRERIALKAEAEAGVQRLPTDQALHGEHVIGLHDTRNENCPDCQEEIEAERAEAGG